jgi:hypothetical protein
MANDKDYNELLSGFEDRKAAPPPVKKTTSAGQEKANLKGGVYFSNPPVQLIRRLKGQRQRQHPNARAQAEK